MLTVKQLKAALQPLADDVEVVLECENDSYLGHAALAPRLRNGMFVIDGAPIAVADRDLVTWGDEA